MIVPGAQFRKLMLHNSLRNRTDCADNPNASEIEKVRPKNEHSWGDRIRRKQLTADVFSCLNSPLDAPLLSLSSGMSRMHHEEKLDLELLKVDIAARLRSACAHLPPGEFADLVHQMACIQLKYTRSAPPGAQGIES